MKLASVLSCYGLLAGAVCLAEPTKPQNVDYRCLVETPLEDDSVFSYDVRFSVDINSDGDRFELIDGATISVDHIYDDTNVNYLLDGRAEINQTLTTIRGTVTQSVYGLLFEIESYKSQSGLNFDISIRHKIYPDGVIYTSDITSCRKQ